MIRTSASILAAIASTLPAFAQSGYTKLSPTTSPSARSSHTMVRSDHDNRILLFGGRLPSLVFSNETWTWGGTAWSKLSPTASPSGRQYAAAAYNLVARKVVLFGGNRSASSSGYLADTWEWDGTNWAQASPTTSPPKREKAAMGYDVANNRMIMFGGVDANVRSANGQDYDDTWSWNGTNWTKLSPTNSPGSRFGHAMCFDRTTGKIILVGGFGWKRSGNHVSYQDMWTWTGSNWQELKPKTLPTFRTHASLHFDDTLGRCVLIGGQATGNVVVQETWEWDGADWSKRAGTNGPRVTGGGAAHHAMSGTTIQFGGAKNNPANGHKPDFNNPSGDTLSYSSTAPATAREFGTGCSGSMTPVFDGTPPWLGETMTMEVTNLPTGRATVFLLGTTNTGLNLGFIGFPQCTLYPTPLVQVPLANNNGMATISVPIPQTGSGVTFYTQVWTSAANGSFLMSNAVDSKTGYR